MMNEKTILEMLQKALSAAVAASLQPTLPIKFMGRTFLIPNDQKYIECIFLPNNVLGSYWGKEQVNRGILRLILHWPVDDAGVYTPMNLLESICNYFSKDRVLQIGETSVKIYENPDLTGMLEAGQELLFPVSVYYRSFNP